MSDVQELRTESGDLYKGQFQEGRPHGHGTLTMANGDVYEGGFKDGLRHGNGKMTSGSRVYDGNWEMGIP